jgi:hypothetical protein
MLSIHEAPGLIPSMCAHAHVHTHTVYKFPGHGGTSPPFSIHMGHPQICHQFLLFLQVLCPLTVLGPAETQGHEGRL